MHQGRRPSPARDTRGRGADMRTTRYGDSVPRIFWGTRPLWVAALVLLAVGNFAVSCKDFGSPLEAPEPAPPQSDFDVLVQPIFTARCAFLGCHAGSGPAQGVNLEVGKAYDEIVNVPSNRLSYYLLVKPSDPDSSLLYLKVATSNPPIGERMPFGGLLSAQDIGILHDWIAAGASR